MPRESTLGERDGKDDATKRKRVQRKAKMMVMAVDSEAPSMQEMQE